MRIDAMNWMQVEEYLTTNDVAVVPLGSTEQHAYLRLAVDSILSQRVAEEAADACSVPVFPGLPYGMTPQYAAYPGTVSLRPSTYFALVEDMLDSLYRHGFRRVLLVNGHGGNMPITAMIGEWLGRHADAQVILHNWWCAPRTIAKVREIDPVATHASWMENFPWTRIEGVTMPHAPKPPVDIPLLRQLPPAAIRKVLGDGQYGGAYEKDDAAMQAIWDVAIEETVNLLRNGWAKV